MVSEGTRDRILEVALELIADKGFAATSTRELSERLGFTKAALYYYFRTKDDLLAALTDPVVNDLNALMDGLTLPLGPAGRRGLLRGYVNFVATHQAVIRVLSHDPSLKKQRENGDAEHLYTRLGDHLAGHADPDLAERVRVRAALGGIHAALLHPRPGDDPDLVRQATLAAACGALGIRPPR